jgi:4-aminobutyrate aminotransferase
VSDLYARHKAVLPDWLALYYQDPLEDALILKFNFP